MRELLLIALIVLLGSCAATAPSEYDSYLRRLKEDQIDRLNADIMLQVMKIREQAND